MLAHKFAHIHTCFIVNLAAFVPQHTITLMLQLVHCPVLYVYPTCAAAPTPFAIINALDLYFTFPLAYAPFCNSSFFLCTLCAKAECARKLRDASPTWISLPWRRTATEGSVPAPHCVLVSFFMPSPVSTPQGQKAEGFPHNHCSC